MKKNLNSGFTLIELLVVIALIVVVASIVIEQLSGARDRGGDAGVKSNLDNIRSAAELYYTTNNSYGAWNGGSAGNCPTTVAGAGASVFASPIYKAIAAANMAGGNGGTRCIVTSNGLSYAVAVAMKTVGQSWCIDSANASHQFTGNPTAAINAGTATCN